MKYVLVIADGMADFPLPELSGKTPLEEAKTPMMDRLVLTSEIGRVQTVPCGVPAGSDTAILSIFGYDPRTYYTGRSSLEAAGSGVELMAGDISYRCNTVSLTENGENYKDKIILSHSGGTLSGEEALALMQDLLHDPSFAALLAKNGMRFKVNPSYRHIAVRANGGKDLTTTPPHDIKEKPITEYLPKGEDGELLTQIMEASFAVLQASPVNAARRKAGLLPVNSLWFWGQGSAAQLFSFEKAHHHFGGAVTAVPLVKGIANLAGLYAPDVEGANGEITTNYAGKVQAGLRILEKDDFAVLHIEAPDECSHNGDVEGKVKAISLIDEKVLTPLVQALREKEEPFRLLLLSDHYTPLSTKTHDGTPVPYLLYDSTRPLAENWIFHEKAAENGPFIQEGATLIDRLFENN